MNQNKVDVSDFKDIGRRPKQLDNALPVIFGIILIIAVQMFLVVKDIPQFVFPKPTEVASSLVISWREFLYNAGITLIEVIIGYILASVVGIIMAVLITQFHIVNAALTPYTIFLATMPMIALIPLLMILLGFGMEVRIIVVVLQTFPIVMMNAVTGINNVDHLKIELMKSLGATRWQTLRIVTIPDALPHIFTGLRLGGIFATTAAIASEFSGGTKGLGVMVITATSYCKMGEAFAGILLIACIGIILYFINRVLENKLVKK